MASSSSSASWSARQWKYEVFLSFRGEDTRNSFTSHLHAALHRKSIKTFIDDKLNRGVEITSGLMKVIEESRIAVIVFSKDYGSSTFCLDEAAKIIKCVETHGQTVVPVFYHVDPLHLKNQNGNFETAFAKHEIHNFEKVQRWKAALSKLASMAGWCIDGTSLESELVEKIVDDILKKLKEACSCDLKGLVGVKSRVDHIKALLFNKSVDVCMLGIWGMGGIGKTTLAEAVFSQIKGQFDGCCFLPIVRINFENNDSDNIIKQLLSQISGEKDVNVTTSDIRCSTFIERMLNKKVLVVVDDVDSSQQLEFFVHNRHVFGKGSKIIVTSRDKHALSWSRVDDIYEVKKLDSNEALKLFCQSAFKKPSPTKEHWLLAHSFTAYADGNPLALKVLGSFLFGRSEKEWKSAWDKLRKDPIAGIQNVLKISYDSLDREEKNIFLHLACFFRGERIDEVIRILNACGCNAKIGLSVLTDKSLIAITKICSYDSLEMHDCLEMHDLLQEMGKGIVREESREPGKRSRLWDHQDIVRVLMKNTGTEAIEAICLDMSKIDYIDVNPGTFKRMSSLKLLKFYGGEEKDGKLRLSQGLDCLPDDLRYLYWHGYPLETLPPNFDPVDLVELHLPYSMNLKTLENIDHHHSKQLVKEPKLLRATNLVHINLFGCKGIECFPSTIGLMSLQSLNLTRCSNLKKFPDVSSNVRLLDLSYTAIKEVPASLGSLCRLETFIMVHCTMLRSIPSSICNLKSLEMFELSGCSSLQQFPEILESMEHLKYLYLDGTAIQELPSSIGNLKGLYWLRLEKCRNLIHLPENLSNLKSLCGINFSHCPNVKKVPENLIVSHSRYSHGGYLLTSVSDLSKQVLYLKETTRCYLFRSVSVDSSLSSIECLDLSDNRFERLPESIQLLFRLKELNISFCDRLQSLPYLPGSLVYLNANECRSLTMASGFKSFFRRNKIRDFWETRRKDNGICEKKFLFTNCLKLDPPPTVEHWSLFSETFVAVDEHFPGMMVIYPGNEIPECFTYKSVGNSIKIPISTHSDKCRFHGDEVALCLVITFPENQDNDPSKVYSIRCHSQYDGTGGKRCISWTHPVAFGSEHLLMACPVRISGWDEGFAFLKFTFGPENENEGSNVIMCGIRPLCTCPIAFEDETTIEEAKPKKIMSGVVNNKVGQGHGTTGGIKYPYRIRRKFRELFRRQQDLCYVWGE